MKDKEFLLLSILCWIISLGMKEVKILSISAGIVGLIFLIGYSLFIKDEKEIEGEK